MPNFNVLDASEQEKIRRVPHVYKTGEGRHGVYEKLPQGYLHQEYPKFMDTTPPPNRKAFKTDAEFEAARADWTDVVNRSIVHNKAEEAEWRKENKAKAA